MRKEDKLSPSGQQTVADKRLYIFLHDKYLFLFSDVKRDSSGPLSVCTKRFPACVITQHVGSQYLDSHFQVKSSTFYLVYVIS